MPIDSLDKAHRIRPLGVPLVGLEGLSILNSGDNLCFPIQTYTTWMMWLMRSANMLLHLIMTMLWSIKRHLQWDPATAVCLNNGSHCWQMDFIISGVSTKIAVSHFRHNQLMHYRNHDLFPHPENHCLSNGNPILHQDFPTPPPSATPAWCSDACPRRHVQWPTSSSKHCVSPVATKGTPSLYLFLISNWIKSEIALHVERDTWEQHHLDIHWHEDYQDWLFVSYHVSPSTIENASNIPKYSITCLPCASALRLLSCSTLGHRIDK